MSIPTVTVALVLAVAALAISPASPRPSAFSRGGRGWARAAASVTPRAAPVCVVRARREARYRSYGYDHIVHLDSGCSFAVSCSVTTNVNPRTLRVQLGAGRHSELLTYRGSPSRRFTVTVKCQRAG